MHNLATRRLPAVFIAIPSVFASPRLLMRCNSIATDNKSLYAHAVCSDGIFYGSGFDFTR